ncbi:MAG TPA: S9 family peptidase, partial [Opitutaceae bacterium]
EYAYRTQLWLAAVSGRPAPRQLTAGEAGASAAVWSPAGDRLAFVRNDAKKKPQLWILPANGGEAWQLTKLPSGAQNPRWSPDGRRLLFTSELTQREVREALEKADAKAAPPPWPDERPRRQANDAFNWPAKKTDKTDQPNTSADGNHTPSDSPAANPDGTLAERREWLARQEAENNPRVTARLNFLDEGDLAPAPRFTQLYVIDARDAATPVPLTPGYVDYTEAAWMPDGKTVLMTGPARRDAHPDRERISSVYAVDVDDQNVRPFFQLDGYSLGSPTPSPDGRQVAFTAQPAKRPGDLSYGQTLVGVVPAAGGTAKLLTEKLDRSAGNVRWSPDSNYLYFVAPTNGGFPLYRIAASGGNAGRLTGLDGGIRAYDVGPAGLALIVTRASNPYELYHTDLKGADLRFLTTHNSEWLRDKTLATLTRRELQRPDGLKVEYWFLRPPFFEGGAKYPLLVEIHGGPAAMWGPGEATTWHEFQYFAARGYAIVFCNPRGSGGYGYRFQRANFQNWGPGPGGDVLAVADALAAEAWVDRDRQVITGGSYGGYLTAWIISQDQRFKAAVAVRGVYDLATFLGEGNAWTLVPDHFGGYPWQKDIRAILDAQSPTRHVEAIRTPLLIKHGDVDFRTGVVQSEMLYKSLKILGREVEYARYPRATHELSRSGEPLQRLDRLVRFDEFFQRYLGAPPATN